MFYYINYYYIYSFYTFYFHLIIATYTLLTRSLPLPIYIYTYTVYTIVILHRALVFYNPYMKHTNRFPPYKRISINLSVSICVKNLCDILRIYFYILRPYTQVLIERYFEIFFDRYYSRWRVRYRL